MLEVVKIGEDIRKEGLNYGLPTTLLKLGPGPEYSFEDLVKAILMNTSCKWVCITGEGTTRVGMGTLVKGLSSVGLYTEVEASGEVKDPGWLHSVDRWVVDYVQEGSFNYNALRSGDMIRFIVKGEGDLNSAREGFELLSSFPGARIIRLSDKKLKNEAFSLARKYTRSRLYVV